MAADFRTQNQAVLIKLQSASGTAETGLSVSTDAIQTRPPEFTAPFESVNTDYTTGSLDVTSPIPAGARTGIRLPCYLRGSGAAGTAPDWGKAMRACAFSETEVGSAVTGTAQAGAAGTITLAAGASSTTDFFVGKVVTITSGTGSSPAQYRVCTAYNGTTKVASVTPNWTVNPDNTSVYSFPAHTLYKPISTSLEVATIWAYQHSTAASGLSRLSKLYDGAGDFTFALNTKGLANLDFNFTGRFSAAPTDVAHPGACTYQSTSPDPYINALAYLGQARAVLSSLNFEMRNTVDAFPDPADIYGTDTPGVVRRQPGGTINLAMSPTATRDSFADLVANTTRAFWSRWGSAAGRFVSIYIPAMRYSGLQKVDQNGYAVEQITFGADSIDNGVYLCVH